MSTLQNILREYALDQKKGLLLLSMPTGFGKTHNVLDFIYQNYHKFKTEKRKIIFITNLKKNLPHEDLKKRFDKDNKQSEYEDNVLFIKSNLDFVLENLPDLEIPEKFSKSKNYDTLIEEIKAYNNCWDNNYLKTYKKLIKKEIREKYEPAFRAEIVQELDKRHKNKNNRLQLIKNNSDYQWIGKLYPTVFTDEKTILFMSMDKFLVKNSTLIEPAYYCYQELTENSLIFIDEFDATKDTILNQIIEKGTENPIDLITLFSNIHNNLNGRKVPSFILKDSLVRKKEISKKKRQSLSKILANLKKDAREIFKDFSLVYTHKTFPSDFKKSRNFLFYDYESHHVLDRKSNLMIETIQEDNVNWLKVVLRDDKSYKNYKTISSLLGRIGGFFSYFQKVIYLFGTNYKELRKENGDEVFSLKSAIDSILVLGFQLTDEKTIELLTNKILENRYSFTKEKASKINNQLQSFYEVGFKYHDIVDNDNHDLTSKIYLYSFDRTPESILTQICQRGMVIGISATAHIDTNIGNYDIKYLKQYLKDSFYSLSQDEINQLKTEYQEIIKGYEKIQIKSKFIGTKDKHEALETLKQMLNDEESANKLCNKYNDDDYIFCRYVRLLEVWEYFNKNEDCQCFICFLNKLPKSGDDKLDLDIIKEYFCYIKNLPATKENQKSIEGEYFILNSENFEEEQTKLEKKLSKGERIFIISTYQTLGAGVNLQYPIPQNFTPIKINDFKSRKKMDINGVYLEKPTNLLTPLNFEEIEQKEKDKNFIKYLFQLEFLFENGAMSRQQFKHKLDEAFRKYLNPNYRSKKINTDNNNLYQTSAFTKYLNKVIIQALGRICRTNMKASTIHILADNSMKSYLHSVSLPPDIIPVREYQELVKNCTQLIPPSEEEKEAKIKAENNSHRAFQYIQSSLTRTWNKSSIEQWQSLRQQVLFQPTITNQSDCESRWLKVYVELPTPNNCYRFTQTNDYGEVEIFFDKDNGLQEVSETACRLPELMKISILKDLFIKNNWATNFVPGELIISPPIFNNIYKGALGEVCGKHILEKTFNIHLLELEENEYERFDFKTRDGIYVDFKFWNNFDKEEEAELEKIRQKMRDINAEKVLIINILADKDNCKFEPIPSDNNKIIRIPFLCQDNKIHPEALKYLFQELYLS
ncbi:hypothetical protein [Cyanobacterium aponinum]|uniref:Helicase/UvrB N-terminal domain-containing protein n=1 Tax=Cyanobacterium aponinum 0216 TaxID=2676140 RepID=A0A844GT10_9CHRO|nr:hypothetical protein [Cyanobacterium aponinum]MTF39627.1 hypothetical protein [Cyanobacterium aponinum 0216]